jgi:hypothetical protein
MAHIPVNHPLQPFYRFLGGLAGLYVFVFGVIGVVRTGDVGTFARQGLPTVLLLHTNRAFAILSIVMGAILLLGAIIGRGLNHLLNLITGIVFLVAGLVMLVFLQTDLNFLGFGVSTCVASFILGLVLVAAGLYGKVGDDDAVAREEAWRHGSTVHTQPEREPQGVVPR